MKKEEKIIEIEEFKLVNIEEFKKHNKPDKEFEKYNKMDDPFSKFENKLMFVVGHALAVIQFDSNNNCWYIDTRAYDFVQINDVLTTHYYRWEFDNPLPEKLLKYIPFDTEIVKSAPIIVGTDKTFKMPTMSGIVVKVSEPSEKGQIELFVVKNPEIID